MDNNLREEEKSPQPSPSFVEALWILVMLLALFDLVISIW